MMEKCRGSRDLLPPDMARFRHVEGIFRACCLAWGYQEVRTPTLEYLHLFTAAGTLTPGRLGRVYSFLDWDGWSGERVALRPEGTIPAARLFVESLSSVPLNKLFYVENIFSFEESGRESRERWQCGAELMGSSKPVADAELILLAREILGRIGLEAVELHLSHAGLLRGLLQESGLTPAEQEQALDTVLNGDMKVLEKALGANPHLRDAVPLLLQLRGRSPGFLRNLQASLLRALPNLEPVLENFVAIAELLSAAGVGYQIDIASGKGFEYYTGITFQFYFKGQRLGGGGRYNDLIPLLGGGDAPASGFAFDMDKLMELLPEGVGGPGSQRVLVRGRADAVEAWKSSVEAARRLREARYVAEFDPGYGRVKGYRWVLKISMRKGTACFLLEDRAKDRKYEASSMEQILKILRKANEASST